MRLPRFRITERQFLLFILAGLMCAYVAAFLVTMMRSPSGPVKPKRGLRVHRLVERKDDVVVSMFDPSLMSLPDRHGFSGALWVNGPRLRQRETEWGMGPSFFETHPPEELPALVPRMSAEAAVQQISQKAPALFLEEIAEPVRGGSSLVKPVFVVVAGLDGRWWREGKALTVVTNETALRPTQVRIAVDGKGSVRFANIEDGSGSESADVQALDVARELKFETVEGRGGDGGLAWGRVKVLWATTLPAGVIPSP